MQVIDVFNDGILVDVNVSFWSGAKALTPQDLGLKPENVAEAYRLGKKFLIPKEITREFRHVESKARRVVEDNSFPFPVGNARFVPKSRFPKVEEVLKECAAKYAELLDKLIESYDELRAEMIPVYEKAAEDAYNQSGSDASKEIFVAQFLQRIDAHYPPAESLRSRYSLSWDVYEVTIPKSTLAEEYRSQVKSKVDSFVDDVVKALRGQAVEACNRVLTNLKEGKVCRGRTISSLKEFIDKFEELNFVGDTVMEAKLQELRTEFLDMYSTTEVNNNEELQVQLGRKIEMVVEVAENLADVGEITGAYSRKVAWEDNEESSEAA